jgi:hypothetical protein
MRGAVHGRSRTAKQEGEERGFEGRSVLVASSAGGHLRSPVLCCAALQVFAQQHPLVQKLEAEVMAKVLSSSEPLDSQNTQRVD